MPSALVFTGGKLREMTMHTITTYFNTACPKTRESIKKDALSYLLVSVLICIPLNYAFSSIAAIVFMIGSLSGIFTFKFSMNRYLLLPMAFYVLMALSLLWTSEPELTTAGLRKEIAFLFLPVPFLFIEELRSLAREKIFRIFSFAMVAFAIYYLVNAFFRYLALKDSFVFFNHELVTQDVNAVYASVFASFAMFYFIAIKEKQFLEKAALVLLGVLVFLLSSKSIITIDFILVVCYYSFFSDVPKNVKITTVFSVFLFLFFSVIFVREVKDRFSLEYETAFVDNTVSSKVGDNSAKVFYVSLKQAWCDEKFQTNHFFPGMALRLYQTRIFTEMLQENNNVLTGFGLEASQDQIREKAREHNLFSGYGDFNFHNQYVQTFAELGLFGFLLLLTMLGFNLKNAWKQQDFLHIAFAITMIVLFLTESFFCRQRGVLFFVVLFCVFNGTLRQSEKKF